MNSTASCITAKCSALLTDSTPRPSRQKLETKASCCVKLLSNGPECLTNPKCAARTTDFMVGKQPVDTLTTGKQAASFDLNDRQAGTAR